MAEATSEYKSDYSMPPLLSTSSALRSRPRLLKFYALSKELLVIIRMKVSLEKQFCLLEAYILFSIFFCASKRERVRDFFWRGCHKNTNNHCSETRDETRHSSSIIVAIGHQTRLPTNNASADRKPRHHPCVATGTPNREGEAGKGSAALPVCAALRANNRKENGAAGVRYGTFARVEFRGHLATFLAECKKIHICKKKKNVRESVANTRSKC